MKGNIPATLLCVAFLCAACCEEAPVATVDSLIPVPSEAVSMDGVYRIPRKCRVWVDGFDAAEVCDILGTMDLSCRRVSSRPDIAVLFDEAAGPEGYGLEIKGSGIVVTASNQDGVFYAFQTLRRLMGCGVQNGPLYSRTVPQCRISDAPRFRYRGFMLDCSRHFFPVEEIKRIIDVMAAYKMNVFHWHLTDDQGWRAEIRKYPLLTSVGATRKDNWVTDFKIGEDGYATGTGAYEGKPYGPYFYSQDDMRSIVAYAGERHVAVLPEIDMPGHFQAALAAYPEFSCVPGSQPEVWTHGGISDTVLNIGNDRAVQFAKDILDELCDIFPYPYFHIGGDECPTGQWKSDPLCREKYSSLGLESFDALQSNFVREIAAFLATKGKSIFCWNESVTEPGADLDLMQETGATVMCWWPCQKGAALTASLGLDAIVTEFHSKTGGYYINRRQSNEPGEPSGAGRGDDTVEGCYCYVPVPSGLAPEVEAHYKGVEATFWTEHVSSCEYLEYLMLPRLVCVAEAGWSSQEHKDWESFRRRMAADLPLLDAAGYTYARHWLPDYVPRTAE